MKITNIEESMTLKWKNTLHTWERRFIIKLLKLFYILNRIHIKIPLTFLGGNVQPKPKINMII